MAVHLDLRGFPLTNITVAVPACNEEACIRAHLAALDKAAARTCANVAVLIFANGCADRTAAITRAFAAAHLDLRVCEATLAPGEANAGMARRVAARVALELFPGTDILVTSDADSELAPASLDAIREQISSGVDLLCGSTSCSLPDEIRNAPNVRRHERLAMPYAALMRELRFGVDRLCARQAPGQVPHYTASGACMAVSRAFYDRIGGLPGDSSSEDRALLRRAERCGARIHFSHAAHATVSPRLVGRAAGGMAETLKRNFEETDPVCDQGFLSAGEARRAWRFANEDHRAGTPPVLPDARRRMRLSDLERELPRLDAFLEEAVRPMFATTSAAVPVGA